MGFVYQVPPVVGGTVLIIERVQSQNFVSGLSGWAINADGTAEFFSVVVRGSLITGVAPGQRIEINGDDFPNVVALFSGNVHETAPGRLLTQVAGLGLTSSTVLVSPSLDSGHDARLSLKADALSVGGLTRAQIDADEILLNTFGTGAAVEVRETDIELNRPVTAGSVTASSVTTGPLTATAIGADSIAKTGETWHTVGAAGEPAFAGNWAVNTGVPVAFTKDATGRVQLRGRAQETVASSATIFTLPAGYRPSQTMSWAVKANNDGTSIGWVTVTTAGLITCLGNVAALRVQTILDAISFPTN